MDERHLEQPDPGSAGSDDLAGAPSGGGSATASGSSDPTGEVGSSTPPDQDRLIKELTAQARVRAAAVAVETAALVDAVAALRPLEGRLGVTWRQWVAWQCGLTTAEARRVCLLAEKLPSLPLIDAAFRRGELSDGITEKVARVATPANEAAVLAAAEAATAGQLERVVRDFRKVRAGATPPPGTALEDPATMPSETSWWWNDHGRFQGRWDLRADDGAVFEAALELALSRFRRTEADIDGDLAGDDADAPAREPIVDDLDEQPDDDAGHPPRSSAGPAPDPDPAPAPDPDPDAGPAAGAPHDGASARAASTGAPGDLPGATSPSTIGTDPLVPAASGTTPGAGSATPVAGSATPAGASGPTPGGSAPDRPEPFGAAAPVNAVANGALRSGEQVGARRSDALVAFANLVLASQADDGLLPEAAQLIVHHNLTPVGHVDHDGTLHPPGGDQAPDVDPALADPLHSLTGATIPGCGAIPDWLAQKLTCDCLTITVAMIGGFPVSEPTVVRAFNRAQRRALRARDRHCRFPGCTRTRHLHAHHTRPWHPTRRTTVAHAVLLCDTHHTLVHLRGLTIALGADHTVTVTRPDGSTLTSTASPPPDPAALAAHRHRRADPPPERRRSGTGERLTFYARDTIATTWHLADTRAAATAADDPPARPAAPDPEPHGCGPPPWPPAPSGDAPRGPAR